LHHNDDALELQQARVASRAVRWTDEQVAALRAAAQTLDQNMAQPVALWLEAGRQLTGAAGGGNGAAAADSEQQHQPGGSAAADASSGANSGGGGGGGSGAPPASSTSTPLSSSSKSSSSPAELLARLERSVNTCALHLSVLFSRFYSVVTPRQLASLLADCYPFCVRPSFVTARFGPGEEEEEEQEEEEEEGGQGDDVTAADRSGGSR
jgi:hypothetical protein